MKSLSLLALVGALMLGGCAATVQRPDAERAAPALNVAASQRVVMNVQLDPQHPQDAGWQAFRKEWLDITSEQATGRGHQFSVQEGQPKPTGQDGVLLVARINDYKHVGVGARVWLGAMTGNAFVDCKIEFRDLKTGRLYGERTYNTSSSAWHGVFAATTPKQIYAIADQALDELRRR
jgi:hypothetical protein